MNYEIRTVEANPSLEGLARISPDIVYSRETGEDLTLRVISPWNENPAKPYPLIVFIQGSAWTFPDINYEIPQLSWYARLGYTVATVTHRSTAKGHPFPAFLCDVKCAIRFMRANAKRFNIDAGRVCVFGTSSGGNIAMLLGLTGDDPAYKTNEYADESDAVGAVVECFGPSDMTFILGGSPDEEGGFRGFAESLGGGSYGTPENDANIRAMSPLYSVCEGVKYPPFLLVQGDADDVVDYQHGYKMYKRLRETDNHAEMICVHGGPHEGPFWSREIHDMIFEFITANI